VFYCSRYRFYQQLFCHALNAFMLPCSQCFYQQLCCHMLSMLLLTVTLPCSRCFYAAMLSILLPTVMLPSSQFFYAAMLSILLCCHALNAFTTVTLSCSQCLGLSASQRSAALKSKVFCCLTLHKLSCIINYMYI
jgi:hypothetical protein